MFGIQDSGFRIQEPGARSQEPGARSHADSRIFTHARPQGAPES
jgi:hypothetical protein